MSEDAFADATERAFKKVEAATAMTEAMKGFTGLSVDLEIKDYEWGKYITGPQFRHGSITRVGNLPNATSAGKPAFQLLANMDDGSQVIVETTWALMQGALRALAARWPVED